MNILWDSYEYVHLEKDLKQTQIEEVLLSKGSIIFASMRSCSTTLYYTGDNDFIFNYKWLLG